MSGKELLSTFHKKAGYILFLLRLTAMSEANCITILSLNAATETTIPGYVYGYIHTYIIGHYNPSVRIIDLASLIDQMVTATQFPAICLDTVTNIGIIFERSEVYL